MEEEFKSLSDKRIDVPSLNQEHNYYYSEVHVKEFIKLLKEIVLESLDPRIDPPLFEERIDNLAGEKLR